MIYLEIKYPERNKEIEKRVYGPFKNLYSAKQYFEIAEEPYIEHGFNVSFLPLETPVLLDISQSDWLAQFTHKRN